MTWKCAQIDRNPSKYFGTNYQSLKMCLKFSDLVMKNNSFIKNVLVKEPLNVPSPGDWQDDVRSSLYTHFWSSYIWTTSPVVWSPQMTRQTSVRFLAGSIFWNFEFRFLWHFHMFRGIYRHIWTENITTTVVWWV